MQTLAIDIETYSSADLLKSGVYRYVEAPDFEIMMLAYSWDGEEPNIIDIRSNPDQSYLEVVQDWLIDRNVLKTAFNANFERTCLSKYFKINLPVDQWECTAAKASMLGLPLNLEMVARVLKLQQQKDAVGKQLIKYFSVPCKPTKANGGRTRNLPHHDPEKWNSFLQYSYCFFQRP
jgi:DNA polymerase bacteriophage-type